MTQLIERKKFFDTGNPKRNRENFQGYLFDSFRQASTEQPISFFRSDFRGVVMRDCLFLRNDFSRSDFIDASMESTQFQKCHFRTSEVYNSLFTNVSFSDCMVKSASWNRLLFSDCTLETTVLQDVTLRECSFHRTKLRSLKLRQNSFDEVHFDACSLHEIDLSNMTALNMFFTDCDFEKVTMEADYLGSYFFKGRYPDKIQLRYRGQIFKTNLRKTELLGNLFKMFLENKRFYEGLNVLIQKNLLLQQRESTFSVAKYMIEQVLADNNPLRREYQLQKFFQLYEFYFNTTYVPIDDYFKLVAFLDSQLPLPLPLATQMLLIAGIQRLKSIFQLQEFSSDFIMTAGCETAIMEIRVPEEKDPSFLKLFDNVIQEIAPDLRQQEVYEIVGKRHGSVIYDIAIHAAVGLFFLKILRHSLRQLRGISHEAVQIAIDFSVNRRLLTEAKKSRSISKINAVKKSQLLTEQSLGTNQSSLKGQELLSICESIKYFPNSPSHGAE